MINFRIRIVARLFNAVLVWILLLNSAFPMSEEVQSEQSIPDNPTSKTTEAVDSSHQKDQTQKERDVSVGFSLLFLIGMAGVTFAVMVVLWGSQLRRMARNRVSRPTVENPLWYLKSKKSGEATARTDSEESNPQDNIDKSG